MLDLKLIQETKNLIDDYILETPLSVSNSLSTDERTIYFKNEGLQQTRSFKMRGAFSKMLRLTDTERQNGLVAISSGNHGVAVSYASKLLGIENTLIIVPKNTPASKIDAIRYHGAKLIVDGDNYDEAHEIGMKYIEEHQMVFIDAYDKDPLIYAGQGTIGLEIFNQNANIDTILVPIGGGGLITGIATAAKKIKPSIRIIGVQTQACPAMKASVDENHFYSEYPSQPSVCEALIGGVGELAYNMSKEMIDDILLVKESTIKKALKHMIIEERTIIEASSCVVIAALMDHPDYDFGHETVLVLSGNNIDVTLMKEVVRE